MSQVYVLTPEKSRIAVERPASRIIQLIQNPDASLCLIALCEDGSVYEFWPKVHSTQRFYLIVPVVEKVK